MDKSIQTLRDEIADLQKTLDDKLVQRDVDKSYSLHDHAVKFDDATQRAHQKVRVPLIPYMRSLTPRAMISGPFVYAMIVPILLLDVCLAIFQSICFRLWDIPLVKRSRYLVIDRQFLAYLNGMEKLNCIYCGYANGVFALAHEIAGCVEKYWCPIKHASRLQHPHSNYQEFTEFGDADAWQEHPPGNTPQK